MKKIITFALILALFAISCKNKEKKDDNSEQEKISTELVDFSKLEKIERVKLKYLQAIIDTTNQNLKDKFNTYVDALNRKITTEEEIFSIFNMRDSLNLDLMLFIDSYYYGLEDAYTQFEPVEKELASLGFICIYAEGMYIGMDCSEILQEEIEKYTSDDFKIYNNFRIKYANSMGGEYPFASIAYYLEAVLEGEKLYKKDKNSKYFQLIERDYNYCLDIVTDIHFVKFTDGSDGCFYGDLNYDYYPYMTSCEDLVEFTKNNKNSMYYGVINNLVSSMSDITVDWENTGNVATVYLVVTDKAKDYGDAYEKCTNYINSGKDIVHKISLKNKGVEEYYVVYRFFSDKAKADNALNIIKKDVKNAYILKVRVPGDFELPEVI
jgi:hypothetical protein